MSMKVLLDLLRDPSLAAMDVDGEERLQLHLAMLRRKRMLREVFTEIHQMFRELADRLLPGRGLEVELGAGVAPMRDTYPKVLATDIVPGPHLDRVLNAERMDLPNATVRVFYGQNCFHHFPHPDRFFAELERTLMPGGGAIILDPYYGPVASFLYKRIFSTEAFDKTYPDWETPAAGPMNGANQALSYIVFVRDRIEFERKHPSLKIVHEQRVGNYLKYLVSGGLNFRQLLPDSMSGFVNAFEKFLRPLDHWLALHHVVVIQKEF